ncbi:MAG TPA: GHKL domain-containing protein [Arachnia sp.]|nr:GHKL domain-containing protein [Arachnia sp.]HMT86146.1 GHKL domain-containing protein [Arachnia sp.]
MTEMLPDIPRLATGLAEWLACVVYVVLLPKRFKVGGTVALLTVGLAALVGCQLFAAQLPLVFWSGGMLTAVATMAVLVWATTRITRLDVGYITARAFVLAEFAASLEWQIHIFYFHPDTGGGRFGPTALLVVVYGLCFGAAHLLERRHFSSERGPHVGPRTLLTAVAIASITFALSNLSFVAPDTPFSGRISSEVFYIRTLVDLCGYIALYAVHEQLAKVRADMELHSMDALVRAQQDHYLHSKNDEERVRRIYHDLKHQVEAIRSELDPARRSGHLDTLEESINSYGRTFDTGNPVADTLLTTKAHSCAENKISFTCIVDGTQLGFVEPLDLATLLGNALDNAIESVLRTEDPDKRLIRVSITRQFGFVILRFDNYFDGELRYVDGHLATRKADPLVHGLGLRSIKLVAEKYGGEASVDASDNWFSLTVLLPWRAAAASRGSSVEPDHGAGRTVGDQRGPAPGPARQVEDASQGRAAKP